MGIASPRRGAQLPLAENCVASFRVTPASKAAVKQVPFDSLSCVTTGGASGRSGAAKLMPFAFNCAETLPASPLFAFTAITPSDAPLASLYLNPAAPSAFHDGPPGAVTA